MHPPFGSVVAALGKHFDADDAATLHIDPPSSLIGGQDPAGAYLRRGPHHPRRRAPTTSARQRGWYLTPRVLSVGAFLSDDGRAIKSRRKEAANVTIASRVRSGIAVIAAAVVVMTVGLPTTPADAAVGSMTANLELTLVPGKLHSVGEGLGQRDHEPD